jgi:hypothetical protein
MPKNTQGGSKHKKGANSESSTSFKNRKLFEKLMADLRGTHDVDGIHFGMVMKKLGDGRMEVDYINNENRLESVKALMKGSIRGRGKSSAWVDVGSYVLLNETGVSGTLAFEIVMPLNVDQVKTLKDEGAISEHLVIKELKENPDGIEFEESEKKEQEQDTEINIDNI